MHLRPRVIPDTMSLVKQTLERLQRDLPALFLYNDRAF